MRTAFVVSALTFIVPALSAPTIIPITKRAGPVKQDAYIVKLKDGVPQDVFIPDLAEKLRNSGSSITYTYAPLWDGFSATLKGDNLNYVRGMPEVESMVADSIVSLDYEVDTNLGFGSPVLPERHNALVGRANNLPILAPGSGVRVYGIDTGIYTGHSCFEGRAIPGPSFVDGEEDSNDMNGHGTHTAGTAVGKDYSVAAGAEIFAVKVLGAKGSGTMSGVMAGVKWACEHFEQNKVPSIATMSLGGVGLPASELNLMIAKCIKKGLHFTIAAGNANIPADGTSPANTLEANTIGAADARGDKPEKASFSNYGTYIDVWAPGVAITSAWIGGPSAENTISGTSMATPGVASILAATLSRCPKLNDPSLLSKELKKHAVKQVTFANATQEAATPNKGFAELWECKY